MAAERGVPSARFTVDHLPPRRRYETWRESIACIFDVDGPRALRQVDGFHATVEAQLIGPLMLARTTTLRQSWTRSPLTIARDGMDHYMIQLYEAGHLRCDHRRGSVEMPVDGLIVFDLSQEVRAHTDDFSNISLIVPRPMLEGALRSAEDQHMRVLTSAEPLVAVLREHMQSVKNHADRLDIRQALELAPVTVGLAAACLNASVRDTPGGPGAVETVLLAAIRREIEARLGDPDLTPAALCGRFRISRTGLYAIFEPLGGVFHYIRERRLRCAMLALIDPAQRDKAIGRVARESGFGSESDFSRAFRKRYGMAPRAARHRNVVIEARAAQAELDRRYERWLRDLAS